MNRQRYMQQMREHGKNPQDQTNEEEISSLPEIELRVMIANMIQSLRNKMKAQIERMEPCIEKIQEKFNEDLKEIKNRQSTMKNIISSFQFSRSVVSESVTP